MKNLASFSDNYQKYLNSSQSRWAGLSRQTTRFTINFRYFTEFFMGLLTAGFCIFARKWIGKISILNICRVEKSSSYICLESSWTRYQMYRLILALNDIQTCSTCSWTWFFESMNIQYTYFSDVFLRKHAQNGSLEALWNFSEISKIDREPSYLDR